MPHNPVQAVLLIVLEGLIVLTLSILGGTRLGSLANGVVVFMLYGLAFIAGWIEQIGALLRNDAAVNTGIVVSLLMPSEAMWRRAAYPDAAAGAERVRVRRDPVRRRRARPVPSWWDMPCSMS